MSLDFLRATGVEPCIESHDGRVIYKCHLDDQFETKRAYTVSSQVNRLDIFVIAETLTQTLCESITQLVAFQDQLTEAALIQDPLPLVVDDMSLILDDRILSLVLSVFEICEHLLDLHVRIDLALCEQIDVFQLIVKELLLGLEMVFSDGPSQRTEP